MLHKSQLPETASYETFEMGSVPLLIVRGQDDIVRAFYNVCVHCAHILANGSGTTNKFICPYHAWTYQLANFKIFQHEYYLTTTAPAGSPDNTAFRYTKRKDMQNSSFNIFPGQDNILIFHMVPSTAEETYSYRPFPRKLIQI